MKATKTKIIATIGPSTNKYDDLKDLHSAGMDVARINMSHASHADALNVIESVHNLTKTNLIYMAPSVYYWIPRDQKLEQE